MQVLAGFSQGAAMSYWVGLQDDEGYAGVVAMSGYLPRAHRLVVCKDTPERILSWNLRCAMFR